MKKNVWIGFQSSEPDWKEWWYDAGQGSVFDGEWKEFTKRIVKEGEEISMESNNGNVSLRIGNENLGQIFTLKWP